ncbi:unnamed protein product [Scytosiphon promiscuus]
MLIGRWRYLVAGILALCHERESAAVAWTTTGISAKMTTQPHKLHATTIPGGDLATDRPSTDPQRQRAVVVGGGPAGALMALSLAQGGAFEVDLFEARQEKEISGPTIRSWNVVLFGRGSKALEAAGVDLHEEAGEQVTTLVGNLRHHSKKKESPFFKGSTSICRGHLAKALLAKASKTPHVNVQFDCAFTGMDMERRVAAFERQNGQVVERAYDMLVGADGVNSRVRGALEKQVPDFTVRQREDFMAFKTITIPIMEMEGAKEDWKERFHVANSDVGRDPNTRPRSHGVITAVVVLPYEGSASFGSLMKTTKDVKDFFARHYPFAFGLEGPSEELAEEFLEKRPQRLKSTYCSSLVHGSAVLIGDAAHSMWASLGQGVNAALEDCQVFAQVLESAGADKDGPRPVDVPKVLGAYNERRFEDALAVCELSEEGMGGGRTMRPAFAAQLFLTVLLNKTLGRLAPKVFQPPSLMTISDGETTYADILRGSKREAIMTKGFLVTSVALVLAGVARRMLIKV